MIILLLTLSLNCFAVELVNNCGQTVDEWLKSGVKCFNPYSDICIDSVEESSFIRNYDEIQKSNKCVLNLLKEDFDEKYEKID